MRTGISFTLTDGDRGRLKALVADRNTSQKHVWRARIVLLSADGLGTNAIMAATCKSKTCVWRWQERFVTEGVEGLLRDKTRPPGKPPVTVDRTAEVVRLTQAPPPHEATHWTLRAMAKAVGLAASTVQGIWQSHGLAPHRWRQFKLSKDLAFAEKLRDVVGLYVAPSAHAMVLSVDEKSQIQALDRTQPGLPMKKGRGATLTHDYRRHGTTTLFAALNVLDGTVVGRNMQRHRHQEFIRFLNALERDIPAGKIVHVILDNYAAHKHAKVRAWLKRHPRRVLHFTPTSCSWLNAVEGFFAKLTRRRLKHGVFHSLVDLQAAINRFIAEHNTQPKPFVWKADPDKIIAARNRGFQTLESIHLSLFMRRIYPKSAYTFRSDARGKRGDNQGANRAPYHCKTMAWQNGAAKAETGGGDHQGGDGRGVPWRGLVSVGFEEVAAKDWKAKVYGPDILAKPSTIYKKPGYTSV